MRSQTKVTGIMLPEIHGTTRKAKASDTGKAGR